MLNSLLRQSQVPPQYRRTFGHLYGDVAWFGVLSGSTVNFLLIYATRLGATPLQIGLLTAATSVVSLLLAFPAGSWLHGRPLRQSVFQASVLYRLGFLLFIPLPWLFQPAGEIWALIAITLLAAIPLTPLGIGFNALFAEAVPPGWRAHVAGVRGTTLAIAFMLSAFGSGLILHAAPFPLGYQIVFAIGAAGAAMSSYHLFHVGPIAARPTRRTAAQPTRNGVGQRGAFRSALRLDIWRTKYRRVLLGLLGFHLAQYLPIPIFPVFNVRVLGLQDDQMGIGTALFYLTVLLASTQLGRISHRFGHRQTTGAGFLALGLYPFLLAFASHAGHYYLISLLGGLAWAFAGGAYANYLLEEMPAADRPAHLAWYNVVLNLAMLVGAIAGPLVADAIGLGPALVSFGLLRFLTGFAILRWG